MDRLAFQLKEIECPTIHRRRLIYISGPCAAESEDQVLETAGDLARIANLAFFRAGLWKPRSREGCFEGVGKAGLPWLKRVRAETGLRVATEVATAAHVEACCDAGIDMVWLGARTTTNPFSVQEIANALRGRDPVVMVKNPVTPDLTLWLGALERIHNAGITRLAAIHRGFAPFGETVYRNHPMWSLPIELKLRCPQLPIVCDPSHIAGRRDLVRDLSQTAMDLDMDGLMIESHREPDRALSDAAQQLLPREVGEILGSLVVRRREDSQSDRLLRNLRRQIDEIDAVILQHLAKRMAVVERIGECKRKENLLIFQAQRWAEILREKIESGGRAGLRAEFVEDLWQRIHQEALEIQRGLPAAEE